METQTPSNILPSHNLKKLFKGLLPQQFLEKYQEIQNTQIEENTETPNIQLDVNTQTQENIIQTQKNTETNTNYLFHLSGGIIISIICFNILINKLKKKKTNLINELKKIQI